MSEFEAVILAAGSGTRMLSNQPKVMHEIAGKSMLSRVIDVAQQCRPGRIHVVVAPDQAPVLAPLMPDNCVLVVQDKPLGTASALATAINTIAGNPDLLVLCGDMPLLRATSLREMHASATAGADLVVLTATVADPKGYGRVIRDQAGNILRIVEDRDAQPEEAAISNINTGVYLASKTNFQRWLEKILPNNATGNELYLTDVVALAVADGRKVAAPTLADQTEALGVNNKVDLACAETEEQRRQARRLLDAGVTIMAPDRLTVRGDIGAATEEAVSFGTDCQIDVGAVLTGPLHCGDRVRIGAYSVLSNCRIEDDVTIEPFCHLTDCVIGRGAVVGPLARLREDTSLGEDVQVGNFVEISRSAVGDKTKIKHLTYLGDATFGSGCNVGAGTVTCNYDGMKKRPAKVGDGVFIGSNVALVAPIELEDEAYVAAGSTLTKNVGSKELAVGRTRQRNLNRWRPLSKRQPPDA